MGGTSLKTFRWISQTMILVKTNPQNKLRNIFYKNIFREMLFDLVNVQGRRKVNTKPQQEVYNFSFRSSTRPILLTKTYSVNNKYNKTCSLLTSPWSFLLLASVFLERFLPTWTVLNWHVSSYSWKHEKK